MSRIEILMAAGLLAVTAPLAAQEADTTAVPAAEAPVAPAGEAPAAEAEAPVAEEAERHDWEFTLAATDKAPGASANVMVTDAEGSSAFVLVATGLPVVDSLDQEGRDVNAYTVWVVPGKDKVSESELAGVLTVTPEGTGRLQAETPLQTFGVIVTATPDGAPDRIGGVPVLTGIPVRPEAPVDAEPAEVAEETADVAEDAAEEAADVTEDVAEEAEEAVEEDRPETDASP